MIAMKNQLLLLAALFFAAGAAQAQSSCSEYYPLQEGATLQYTNFDRKGKEEGKLTYKVVDVASMGDMVAATMQMDITDDKGNLLSTSYGIRCEGEVVKVDFRSLMNEQMLSQMGEVEMEVEGTDLEWPNKLSVGQELPDGNINLKMKMAGTVNMNMNVETLNRKVEKKETLTTPAGSFDCFVVYSETRTKLVLGNQVLPSRIWLAPGVGMIKQESYTKGGKLVASSLLTEFSR